MKRTHKSGRHVAETLLKPITEAEYIGDPGICPMCHSKLIEIRNDDHNFPAICGICGVRGTAQVVNNKVKFEIAEEDKAHSHVLLSGKFGHADELMKVSLKPNSRIHELPERLKKYKNYLHYSKPIR